MPAAANHAEDQLRFRSEHPTDAAAIGALVTRAFNSPIEAVLIESIRKSPGYLPDLSVVAEGGGTSAGIGSIVGHVMISRAFIDTGTTTRPIAMLSPLAVDPPFQGQGIGAALVAEGARRAKLAGESAVVLEGNPRYYGRLGFEPAARYGLRLPLPVWAPPQAAQVMWLGDPDPTLAGAVLYPPSFDAVTTLPDTISSDRLLLRRWLETDVDLLAAAVTESVDHLRPWMPWAAFEPLSRETRLELLRTWDREWRGAGDAVFGVFGPDGTVLGGGGLHRRIGPDGLEIGYWVHPAHLHKGIGGEIARLLTGLAFTAAGVTRVEIHHDGANHASGAIPRSLGYDLVFQRPRHPAAPAEMGVEWVWRCTADQWTARNETAGG